VTVDRSEVQRIAKLARLRFDDDQADRLAEEMNDILEYASRLRALREDPGEQQPDPSASGTRSEGAEEPDPLFADLVAFAPRETDGFFVVPPLPGLSHDPSMDEDGSG
jgi:aspartyl-tRNA(Asn)/glutamyl-tRNA(Gln) amidotransferase subunit C